MNFFRASLAGEFVPAEFNTAFLAAVITSALPGSRAFSRL